MNSDSCRVDPSGGMRQLIGNKMWQKIRDDCPDVRQESNNRTSVPTEWFLKITANPPCWVPSDKRETIRMVHKICRKFQSIGAELRADAVVDMQYPEKYVDRLKLQSEEFWEPIPEINTDERQHSRKRAREEEAPSSSSEAPPSPKRHQSGNTAMVRYAAPADAEEFISTYVNADSRALMPTMYAQGMLMLQMGTTLEAFMGWLTKFTDIAAPLLLARVKAQVATENRKKAEADAEATKANAEAEKHKKKAEVMKQHNEARKLTMEANAAKEKAYLESLKLQNEAKLEEQSRKHKAKLEQKKLEIAAKEKEAERELEQLRLRQAYDLKMEEHRRKRKKKGTYTRPHTKPRMPAEMVARGMEENFSEEDYGIKPCPGLCDTPCVSGKPVNFLSPSMVSLTADPDKPIACCRECAANHMPALHNREDVTTSDPHANLWCCRRGFKPTGLCELCGSVHGILYPGDSRYDACHDEAKADGGDNSKYLRFLGHKHCNMEQQNMRVDDFRAQHGLGPVEREHKVPEANRRDIDAALRYLQTTKNIPAARKRMKKLMKKPTQPTTIHQYLIQVNVGAS